MVNEGEWLMGVLIFSILYAGYNGLRRFSELPAGVSVHCVCRHICGYHDFRESISQIFLVKNPASKQRRDFFVMYAVLFYNELPAERLPVFDYMHVVESGRHTC